MPGCCESGCCELCGGEEGGPESSGGFDSPGLDTSGANRFSKRERPASGMVATVDASAAFSISCRPIGASFIMPNNKKPAVRTKEKRRRKGAFLRPDDDRLLKAETSKQARFDIPMPTAVPKGKKVTGSKALIGLLAC